MIAGIEAGKRAQPPLRAWDVVEVDQPLVDVVPERMLDRILSAVEDETVDDGREDRQIIRRRHQVTPSVAAASTPDRQPSSWNPQPWYAPAKAVREVDNDARRACASTAAWS